MQIASCRIVDTLKQSFKAKQGRVRKSREHLANIITLEISQLKFYYAMTLWSLVLCSFGAWFFPSHIQLQITELHKFSEWAHLNLNLAK